MDGPNARLNLILLGRTRAGKSASGNTILRREAFKSKRSSRSVTQDIAVESGTVGHIPVTVFDTPGLFNTHMRDDEIQQMINEKVLQKCESGPCVFLLVIKAERFTEEERKAVEKIEEILGEKHLEKTWILFTRGDELEDENMTVTEFINDNETLKNLVQKYDQRYHVFNNKKRGHTEQVQMLLVKLFKPYFAILKEEVPEILKQNLLRRKILKDIEPATPAISPSSRRIVLLGKSGVGKSASGNMILGQKEFDSVMRMSSVTHECSEAHATVSGRSVSVVDTPGFFDTKMKPEELIMEIARSVYLSSPGPHAFLIVFPVNNRFTEQELQIPQMIKMMFGQEVLKYSIILFTHGDHLYGASVEELIEENSVLRGLVFQFGGRFHVFNNKDQNNREQVNDLLQKIDTMIEQNGGGHYSNQKYEDAQRFRREERRIQQEEKQRREEIERVRKETRNRVRAEAEQEILYRKKAADKSSRFKEIFNKKQHHLAAVAVGSVVGGLAGDFLAEAVVGGDLATILVCEVIGAVAGGAAGGGAATGTVAGAVGGAVSVTAAFGAVAGTCIGGAVGGFVGGTTGGAVGGAVGGIVGGTAAGAVAGAVGGVAANGTLAGAGRGAADGAAVGAVVGAAVVGSIYGATAGAAVPGVGARFGTAVGGVLGGTVAGSLGGAVVGGATSGTLDGALDGAAFGAAVGSTVGLSFVGPFLGHSIGGAVGPALVLVDPMNLTNEEDCMHP